MTQTRSAPVAKPVEQPPSQQPPAQQQPAGGVKETIESILIAFILAFVFRAFVVEAFVIPTGSMAPTLLGAHMRFTCDDCGYRFDLNYSSGNDPNGEPIIRPSAERAVKAICPNCGYKIPNSRSEHPAYDPPVRYGDRILVLKYLYLFDEPSRWDIVVFKNPTDPDHVQNYIKRLVGRPNEQIVLIDGDVYAGPHDAPIEKLQIQTKPRNVQEAMWRIVADNDFYPRGVRSGQQWEQPWTLTTGQTGWNLGESPTTGRVFTFNNPSGEATIWFDAKANPSKHALTDFLAYDAEVTTPGNTVADLKLNLFYDRQSGDGPLKLKLTKFDDTFVTELTRDKVRLLHSSSNGSAPQVIGEAPLKPSSAPRHIEFTNVDYRVTVRIDGENLVQTKPDQYVPDVRTILDLVNNDKVSTPSIEITAQQQAAKISHVSLWRDLYYTSRNDRGKPLESGTPENPIKLGEGEYFVLGDNSPISGDSRYWENPINLPHENLIVDKGRVPERFLLGKAFFVYWPAGYKPMDHKNVPAVVPNFGDMRSIE